MQRACTVLVLLGIAAVVQGDNCTVRFANLTTCSVFNGVLASGDAGRVARTNSIQDSVVTAYGSDTGITRSESCMGIYHAFTCLTFMNTKDEAQSYIFGVPCDDAGQRLQACVDWCYQYANTCYSGQNNLVVRDACKALSAPVGQACFGNNGVLGMKPGSASTSRPSSRWVALPLALAAVSLGGWF